MYVASGSPVTLWLLMRRVLFLAIVICDSLLNSGNPSSVHLPDARPIPNYALSTNIEGHFDIDERKKSHSARDIFVSGLCSRCFSGPGDEQHPMTASSMLMAEAVAMALSFHRTSVPAVMRFPYTGVLDIYTPGIDAHSAFGTSSVREAQRALHRRRRFIQKALFELDELGTVIEYQLHPQMKISCSLQQQNLMRQLSTIKDEYEAHLTYLNQDTMAKQTETLSRVTKLGFLLLPFTTVSGLLSIQESYRYLILIPLVALLMVILILLGIRGLEIRDIQERTMSWFRHDLGLILKGLAGRFWRPKKEGAQTA